MKKTMLFFIASLLVCSVVNAAKTRLSISENHEHNYYTTVSADGTYSVVSENIDVSKFEQGAIQLVYTNLATNSVFNLETSLDSGASWDVLSSASETVSGSGSHTIALTNMIGGYVRIRIEATVGNSSSSFRPYVIGKGTE